MVRAQLQDEKMYAILVVIHVIVSLILILVVLLQSGKAGDLATAFGGASSQAAFGARGGATFLSKATTTAAALFMVTCLGLSILSSSAEESVIEGVATPPAASETTDQPSASGATGQEGQNPAQPPPSSQSPSTSPGAAPSEGQPEGQGQ